MKYNDVQVRMGYAWVSMIKMYTRRFMIPGDGTVNLTDLCQSLVRGAAVKGTSMQP